MMTNTETRAARIIRLATEQEITEATTALQGLDLSQRQALYSELFENGSDSLSTLGHTALVCLGMSPRRPGQSLILSEVGRVAAALYAVE